VLAQVARKLFMLAVALTALVGCGNPEPPGIDIWTAAATGNVEAVRQHAVAGTALDAKDPTWGGTPLMAAAVNGQTEAARLLIKKRVPLEARNKEGATALLAAAFFCHPDTVKVLLEGGADVNARNNRGETPLDTVTAEWGPQLQKFYELVAEALQIDIDCEKIRAERPEVAALLRQYGGRLGSDL